MVAKFVLVAVLVASVSASGGYSSFSYGVSDPNTGDIKDQHEKRVGGNVVGKYSLLEADGTKRIVEYSANDATGFKAVVHKEPAGAHGAAAIGSAHVHPAHLHQLGGAGILANPIAHHTAPLATVPSLNNHAAQIVAASSHGATLAGAHAAHAAAAQAAASQAAAAQAAATQAAAAQAAATQVVAAQAAAAQAAAAQASKIAHANKVAHAAHTAAPLAHVDSISPIGQLAHSASLAAGVPLSHGLYGNNLAANAGHPSSLYAGYGNPLAGSLDYANRGAPTVSSYSHTIVHNGPDAFPNRGAYGSYGGYGYGGLGLQGTGLAGSPLIHNNPWASGAALTQSNPWASSAAFGQSDLWAPRATLSHGAVASPLATEHGSRLGW